MVWLAFDLSVALGGFALLALGRWLIDVVKARVSTSQQATGEVIAPSRR